ncbi:MAG TPA: GNAT family N-acetyltransferase, partial [Thermodesulfobacteriota bacterium]|nr:GNAT family N-acetyltransferase [Thermodesulfobacteriota bacterium]
MWGYEPLAVIPLAQLMTAARFGGLCLGAFDGDRLVAFLYGFVGLKDGAPVHISQRMAVLPAYRDRGLGERLKRLQREHVLAQGLSWVRWTFDPLETRNGYLNFVKLGAHARTYLVDLYGPVSGALNEGLPTDRFEVEWHVRSRRVAAALAGGGGARARAGEGAE